MDIFIDESGSFVSSNELGSWSTVAAYVSYSSSLKASDKLLTKLKVRSGRCFSDEIKLKDVSENDLKWFLVELNKLDGKLFFAATDTGLLNDDLINEHKSHQANKVIEFIDRMQYQKMKDDLNDLRGKILGLSPQLYLQLVVQTELIHDVIYRGITYFVQKKPYVLSDFMWSIDQKNTTKIAYEEAFENLAPPLLQSISISDPMPLLTDCDYSFMDKYIYSESDAPIYLKEHYGVEAKTKGGFNIGKILNTSLHFKDSKASSGVQVSDLLASISRRLLRNGFSDNDGVAKLIGSLMLRNKEGSYPMKLVSFKESAVEDTRTAKTINIINSSASSLIVL